MRSHDSPHRTEPDRTRPQIPCPARPRHNPPKQTGPYRALKPEPCRALPNRTASDRTEPYHTLIPLPYRPHPAVSPYLYRPHQTPVTVPSHAVLKTVQTYDPTLLRQANSTELPVPKPNLHPNLRNPCLPDLTKKPKPTPDQTSPSIPSTALKLLGNLF
jgi:hypothetical protein